jgi:hypothetical protein
MGSKLRDETLDDVPLWRIQCVKGKAGDGGVVVSTLYVTKKWERVQDVLDNHYDSADPRKKDYYLVVTRLMEIDQEEFALDEAEKPTLVSAGPPIRVHIPGGPNRQERRRKK